MNIAIRLLTHVALAVPSTNAAPSSNSSADSSINQLGSPAGLISSGSTDVDRGRTEVKESPATAENYQERSLLLFTWLASLQQQGADTHPFFDSDKSYYMLEGKVNQTQGPAKKKVIQEMGEAIAEGYQGWRCDQ